MKLSSLASPTTTLSANASSPATAASAGSSHLPFSPDSELSSPLPLSFAVPPLHDDGINSYRFTKIMSTQPFSPDVGVDCAGSPAGFSPLVKTTLSSQDTTVSTAISDMSGSRIDSSSPSRPPVFDVPSDQPAPSYADRVKGAGKPSPPRSSLVFTVASSAMRVSKDNGVSVRASSARASLQDYAEAIFAYGIPAHQLTDLSRVGGMVQAFFKDSSWASQLLQTGLAFRSEHLDVLPVGVAPRSVTVSEVPPWVPDFVVLAVLGRYGDVHGRLRTLPASITFPGVKSVRSNRRVAEVTFASPEAFAALPARETITVNGESLVLQFNVPLKCRRCGLLGHPAQSCPRLFSDPVVVPEKPVVPEELVVPEAMVLPEELIAPEPSDASTLAPHVVPSPDDMDTSQGFTLVSRRKPHSQQKRPLSPSSPATASDGLMRPPGQPPKRPSSRSKYFHDAASNIWRDLEGVFTPLLSLSALRSFVAEGLVYDNNDALVHAQERAPDDASLMVLARQIMVYAYTSPRIAAYPPAKKKRARHEIYQLACLYRGACGLATESDSSTV